MTAGEWCPPLVLLPPLHRLLCRTLFLIWRCPACMCCSQDQRHNQRARGWAPKGSRTRSRSWFQRGKRYSAIALMSARGVLDWYTVRDAVSAADLIKYAKKCLVRWAAAGAGSAVHVGPSACCF